jgi:GntR family transcriptional regulator
LIIAIDEADPRPIYQQIVDEVRRGMVLGSLAADDPLPSVRQLAADLSVNPNTVQQAYRELERAGLAYVRRGQGTYVARLQDGGAAQERSTVAASVAQRALLEAHRHGLGADDLIEAIRRAASGNRLQETSEKGGTHDGEAAD